MVERFDAISGIRVHIVKFRPVRWQGFQPLFLPHRENIGKERIEVKKSVMIIPIYGELLAAKVASFQDNSLSR